MERLEAVSASGLPKIDKSASKITRIAAGAVLAVAALACEENTQEVTPSESPVLVNIRTLTDCGGKPRGFVLDDEGFLVDRVEVQFTDSLVPKEVIDFAADHGACVMSKDLGPGEEQNLWFFQFDNQAQRDAFVEDANKEQFPAIKLIGKLGTSETQ